MTDIRWFFTGFGIAEDNYFRRVSVIVPVLFMLMMNSHVLYADREAPTVEQAERHFLQGEYSRVVQESTQLIASRSGRRDELYYMMAVSELKTNKFKDARQSFGRLISNYASSERAFDAYVGIGDSFYLEGSTQAAMASYEKVLEKFPGGKQLALVHYRIGECYNKLGDTGKAKESYDKVKDISPLSFEARMAPDKIESSYAERASVLKGTVSRELHDLSTSGLYSVQVGSFRNKKNALKMVDKLNAAGFDASIEGGLSDNGFYRVKVGKFRTKQEAESTAGRLRVKGYTTKVRTRDANR